jgi:hypothetical protein
MILNISKINPITELTEKYQTIQELSTKYLMIDFKNKSSFSKAVVLLTIFQNYKKFFLKKISEENKKNNYKKNFRKI